MALQRYPVNVNGVETTLKLTDAEAERMGVRQASEPAEVPAEKQAVPQNKARSWPRNKRK